MTTNKKTVELTDENIKKSFDLIDQITSTKVKKEMNYFQKAVVASEEVEVVVPKKTETTESSKFEKALGAANLRINELEKSLIESGKKLGSLKDLGTLLKGIQTDLSGKNDFIKGLQDELKGAKEGILAFEQRLAKMENLPFPAKSLTTDYIKKSFVGNEIPNELKDKNILSLSKNNKEIKNLLGSKMEVEIKKGVAEHEATFAKAALAFEAKGVLSKESITALNKEGYYFVD